MECVEGGRVILVFSRFFALLFFWNWLEVTLRWQVCTLTGHAGWVECIAFSSDGKCIVSGSTDGLVKIWDAGTGAEVRFFAYVC